MLTNRLVAVPIWIISVLMGHVHRGESLAAVVEAALDAGLDLDTITRGLGYTRLEHLRKSVRAFDPKLALALRRLKVRPPAPPAQEIIAMLDGGFNAVGVCRAVDRHPSTIAEALKRAGYIYESRRFKALDSALCRARKQSGHGNGGAILDEDCPAAILY